MAEENKKIVGFKKFTDIKGKSKIEEVNPSLDAKPMTDSDLPANPNISKDSKKIEKPISRKNLIPQDQTIDLPSDEDEFENNINLKDIFPSKSKQIGSPISDIIDAYSLILCAHKNIIDNIS